MRWLPTCALTALMAVAGCRESPIDAGGELGRPIALATGDGSQLLRLAFIDDGCFQDAGGCPSTGAGACEPLLIDSLVPISAFRQRSPSATNTTIDQECIEVRAAAGLAAPVPSAQDLAGAVARFRFDDLPLVRAPRAGGAAWSWTAGDHQAQVEPGGVLGGNLLRDFGVRVRRVADEPPTVTFYGEFPGTEGQLADQGRTSLPLQFPGSLLGKDLNDRCDIGGEGCQLFEFDLRAQPLLALERTRMVMDACMAPPPCTLTYEPDADPLLPGTCALSTSGADPQPCAAANDPVLGGKAASLVVATGVPGLVLFDDSAARMFGDLNALSDCAAPDPAALACVEGQAGQLFPSGWPPAGPLVQLRVRALALVPGLNKVKDEGPCTRVTQRYAALSESDTSGQCPRYRQAALGEGDIRNTTPPYSATPDNGDGASSADDLANRSLAVLGEVSFAEGQATPDAARWLQTLVVPASHPLVLAVRQDVVPGAIEPDGLIGTALFEDTDVVLDYTDDDPGLRVKCLRPQTGTCLTLPDCRRDASPSCCFGLPLPLLVEFIQEIGAETCCAALSAEELADIQAQGEHCLGLDPP